MVRLLYTSTAPFLHVIRSAVFPQIIRLINKDEPKATALVFKTGKVVVTGSRSNASVDYACKTFARILSKLENGSGGPSHKINFK